jgi:uncharacterized protein
LTSLDADVLVSAFQKRPNSLRARRRVFSGTNLLVSAWAVAEFTAVLMQDVRERKLADEQAEDALRKLQLWQIASHALQPLASEDVPNAAALIRRPGVNLRAPDALHLAVAERLGAAFATFDAKLIVAAETLGIRTVRP